MEAVLPGTDRPGIVFGFPADSRAEFVRDDSFDASRLVPGGRGGVWFVVFAGIVAMATGPARERQRGQRAGDAPFFHHRAFFLPAAVWRSGRRYSEGGCLRAAVRFAAAKNSRV